jgi:archaellum component FlaC
MTVDERFDRVEELLKRIGERFDRIDERFARIDGRFDRIDERFARIDERFEHIDERFEHIDERFERIDERFAHIDERFERIDNSIQEMKRSISDLTGYVLDFRQETATHFQSMENRLDVLASTVASLDTRQPAVAKALMEFGAVHTQLVREQSVLRDSDRSLASRVEKLEEIVSKLMKPAA